MDGGDGMKINIPSPCFVIESDKLEENLNRLSHLESKTGVQILHTLKSYNSKEGLDLIGQRLSGFSLGNMQEYQKIDSIEYDHIHSYAPYFYPQEIDTIAKLSNTISFNSLNQYREYQNSISKLSSVGIRINPKLTIRQPKYCNPNYSMRLGVEYQRFLETIERQPQLFDSLDGLHFHALCSQGLGALKYLLSHIEKNYIHILPRLKWLNLGGGHQLAHTTYDSSGFISTINSFRDRYPHLEIYFEPGESITKDIGYLSTTVLDIIPSKSTLIVILDISIEVHLLDVAITKQKPPIKGTMLSNSNHHYLLTGISCIAGDIIGDYYFEQPLKIGDRVIFEDMIGYTIVKQTQFNGIKRASLISN